MRTLRELRYEIEKIDTAIIEKLAESEVLSKEIGLIKQKEGKEITDFSRKESLLRYYESLCGQYNLETSFIKGVFKLIIFHSRSYRVSVYLQDCPILAELV